MRGAAPDEGRRAHDQALDRAEAALAAKDADALVAALNEALSHARAAFGDAGPDVATVAYATAANELEAGKLEAAEEHATLSATALSSEPQDKATRWNAASDTPNLVRVRALIAAIRDRCRGDVETEDPAYEKALQAWADAARESKDDEAAGAAFNQLALAMARRGARDAAAQIFLDALAHRTRAHGADALPTLETLYNAATFRDKSRSLDVVAADLERVIAGTPGKSKRERDLHESSLHNLAVLREEQGDAAGAVELLERALAAKEARLSSTDAALRPTLVRLAQIHHREGRLVHALGTYERALKIARSELGEEHPVTIAIDAWRAEVTQGVGPEALRRN